MKEINDPKNIKDRYLKIVLYHENNWFGMKHGPHFKSSECQLCGQKFKKIWTYNPKIVRLTVEQMLLIARKFLIANHTPMCPVIQKCWREVENMDRSIVGAPWKHDGSAMRGIEVVGRPDKLILPPSIPFKPEGHA